MKGKSTWSWGVLVGLALGIRIFAAFPAAVERYYSQGVYPPVATGLRMLFGWIPFSIGDLLYGLAGAYLLYQFLLLVKKIITRMVSRPYLYGVIKNTIYWTLVTYIAFNLLWGLNYNRRGIAYQLQLQVAPYSTAELCSMVGLIVERMNACDSTARLSRGALASKKALFDFSSQAYDELNRQQGLFAYRVPSVKPSIFSYLGDYLGFTGYYNPFSGEAQVNTTVPVYVQPFTTCHEIGHQLGYAKENEANFAGFLSSRASPNPAFRYSVYFDLYTYAARELYVRDSNLLKPFRSRLRPSIRRDYRELRDFYDRYQNPFEPIVRSLYGNYLKANEQPQGIMSYNEVIAWLIAYWKKYGAAAI